MSGPGFPVYDFRKDIRNVFVSPEMRCRFMRMEPGTVQTIGHSHDLGQEVFLVLQGKAVFEIDGKAEELGPGQMCIALVNQVHRIRVTSDEPMIMYLSVSPHIQPTHTRWTAYGKQLPHTFVPSSRYDVKTDTSTPIDDLIDRFVNALGAFANVAYSAADKEQELAAALKRAIANKDDSVASDTRNSMWDVLYPLYQRMYELASLWNDLAPRAAKTEH